VDGEFESAKFLRPSSSLYHDVEDCLVIIDSEVLSLIDWCLEIYESLYEDGGTGSLELQTVRSKAGKF
jgi:hypothetical protein